MERALRLGHVVDIVGLPATCLCALSCAMDSCIRPRAMHLELVHASSLRRSRSPRPRWSRGRSGAAGSCATSRRYSAEARMSVMRLVVRRERRRSRPRSSPASTACRSAPPRPPSRASASPPCRRRRCGRSRRCRSSSFSAEGAAERGDVLVAALADLVDRRSFSPAGRCGIVTLSTNSPGCRSCLP